MQTVKLDPKQLYGFRILPGDVRTAEKPVLSAKLGQKEGQKNTPLNILLGSKLGEKAGAKTTFHR